MRGGESRSTGSKGMASKESDSAGILQASFYGPNGGSREVLEYEALSSVTTTRIALLPGA